MAPTTPPLPPISENPYVQHHATHPPQHVQNAHFPQWAPPYRGAPIAPPAQWLARRKVKPAPFRAKEIAIAVALVASADVALWNHEFFGSGGFGLAILFAALPLLAWFAARRTRMTPRAAAIAGMLALVVGRCLYHPTAATIAFGFALTGAFVVSLRMRRTFVPELLAAAFGAIDRFPSRLGAAYRGVRAIHARTRIGKVSILPVVVPLALLAVFTGVFALANPVVAHGVERAWDAIARTIGIPSPLRIGLWFFGFVFACMLLRPAIVRVRANDALAEGTDVTATQVLVARNALGLLNVLFFAYNALDATCLWAGTPPAGVTTQQYAHEGAFWLTIALALVSLVVGVFFRGAMARAPEAKLSRRLAYAWMAQGFVLAVGTYRRIAIHVAWSGLSDLRIVGILGTSLVVLGMVFVIVKLHKTTSFGWMLRRQFDAFAVTALLYAVIPTHLISARVNVSRIEHGEYRPVLHMFRQSDATESAAALVPLLHHDDIRVRQGVAVLLDQKRTDLRREVDGESSFRQRDLLERRTLAALDEAAPDIDRELANVSKPSARSVLLQMSRVANEGSLEELFAIPVADQLDSQNAGTRDSRY